MKLKIAAITLTLLLSSGCASKQFDLGSEHQTQSVSACGKTATVAIENAEQTVATEAECREMEKTAKAGNGASNLALQILGYAAGWAIGSALF